MAETIVFFPKYTTLPSGTFDSDPFDVTGYKTISAETHAAVSISSGTLSVQMQQSSDLLNWTSFGSAMAPVAPASVTEVESDPARYIRARATVAGSTGVCAFWVKAVARES